MEKENESILLKSRSPHATIAAGFRLYLGQFKRIFRYTWVIALLFSVVCGLFGTYYVMEYPRLIVAVHTGTVDMAHMVSLTVGMGTGLVAVLAVHVLYWAYVFSMLDAHKSTAEIPWAAKVLHMDRKMTWRMLKAMLWALLVVALVALVGAAVAILGRKTLSPAVTTGLLTLVLLVVAVLLVPLYYVFCKYLLTPGLTFTRALAAGYPVGLRHLGALLAVVVVTLLLVAVVALLLSLPMQILYLANIQAQTGLLMGDPLGMPAYMPRLTAAVFVLATFLQAYVLMAQAFPLYYAYGSIEATEEERRQALGKLKERNSK